MSDPQRLPIRPVDEHFEYMAGSIGGIVLAAVVFVSILSVVLLGLLIFSSGIRGALANELLDIVAGIVIALLVAIAIAAASGMISIYLIWIVNGSLGHPLNKESAAVSAGSLAGYVSLIGLVFTGEFVAYVLLLAATALGAAGASWSAKRCDKNVEKVTPAECEEPFTLTISRLMIVTVWFALIFSVIRLTSSWQIAGAIFGWFAANSLILGIAWLFGLNRKPKVPA